MLHGRSAPIALIDELLAGARDHRSGALLLYGEAGIGKTALLDYAASRADEMTVVHATGFPSESGFGFAALGQLAGPLAGFIDQLPGTQARALRSALGLDDEPVRDRVLVFAALLSLLAESAETRPTLCLVDDIQWVDPGSAEALTFVARRLQAEGVAVVFTRRTEGTEDPTIRGIPGYALQRLTRADSRALLREQAGGAAAPAEDRLLEESDGNPLALLELPRILERQARAHTEWPEHPPALGTKMNEAFLEQTHRLSSGAQTMLLVVAADPESTAHEVLDVARTLGVGPQALTETESSGLIQASAERLAFRHPLIRAAVYGDAAAMTREQVHGSFARKLQGERQVARQARHLSLSTGPPDEQVAEVLEGSARWSTHRGALEAASAAWERAADFSGDSERAASRMMAAADAARLVGEPARAKVLLGAAAGLFGGEALGTELDVVRGRLELRTGTPADAHGLLSSAARRITSTDPVRALRVLTEAGEAASYAGDRDLIVATGLQAAELVAVVTGEARLPGLVLIGSGKVVSGEAPAGRVACQEAIALADGATEATDLVWASIAAQYAGDEIRAHALAARAVSAARTAGQLSMLPYALEFKALAELYASRFAAATSTANEGLSLARDLRQENSICRHLATLAWVDAVQLREEGCRERSAEVLSASAARGLGLPRATAHWALGLLELGLGRPQEAHEWLLRLLTTAVGASHPGIALLAVPDVVETALRLDRLDEVAPLVTRFEQFAGESGPPWARALAARCRALISDPDEAEPFFTKAMDLHTRANRPWDQARTALLYGEHLRRQRRRVDARPPLRAAAREFERLGATAWLKRAQGELRATGEHTGAREVGSFRQLTSQEFQIVGLVSDGSSNRSVAEQLFLSPRTVEYHLSKVYAKLGISSRSALVDLDLETAGSASG